MIVCIHHNDADGFASAAVVKRKFPNEALRFFGMQYDMPLPMEDIKGNDVYIVDFSPNSPKEFDEIVLTAKSVAWIDHHQTAIEKHSALSDLPGIRRVGTAACELAWEYFFPGEGVPEVIKLLGDYDVWRYQYGDRTKYFQEGCRMLDMRPMNYILWKHLFAGTNVEKIVKDGSLFTQISDYNWERSLRAIGYVADLDGHVMVCCNVQGSSATFDSLRRNFFDVMCVYGHNGELFKATLYSDKDGADVSAMAVKYGGGGHKNAAGFFFKEFPWKFIRRLCKEDFL